MIENKSLGSKIFDVLNVVFLAAGKPLMQEKLLSGRLASICSPTRRFWEKVNFLVRS